MSEFVKQLLIVCPLLFLAGMCDAIAGGGGTISLPAFLLAGLPTHFALGTNKMCMSMGTAVSVYRYGKSGRIRWFVSLFAAAGAVLGAMLGARIALLLDDGFMRYVLMVLLPASALFLALNRNFGHEGREKQFPPTKTAVIAFLCAFGLFLSSALSRPVAMFTAFALLAVMEMAPSVVSQFPDALDVPATDLLGLQISRAVAFATSSVSAPQPLSDLATGTCVEWSALGHAALVDALAAPAVLLTLAALLVRRRASAQRA